MVESLLAVRDRRERVIGQLSEQFAADVLEVDELERRLDLAHSARTLAELDAVVADLDASGTAALVPLGPLAVADPARSKRRRLRVVMGNLERRGRWIVPETQQLQILWGNVTLDFRDASLAPGLTTIDIGVTMGNLELILPPQLAIEVDVSSFLGSVDERHRTPPDLDPAQPALRIIGAVRLGSLEITTRLAGESRRAASRRERRDRRELREVQRKALRSGHD